MSDMKYILCIRHMKGYGMPDYEYRPLSSKTLVQAMEEADKQTDGVIDKYTICYKRIMERQGQQSVVNWYIDVLSSSGDGWTPCVDYYDIKPRTIIYSAD